MNANTEAFSSLHELIMVGAEALNGIFEEITNGITITNSKSEIIYVNQSFTTITGYSKQEAIGDNPGILHSGRHDKIFYQNMWKELDTSGRWQGEIWNRNKSGQIFPVLLTITKIISNTQQTFYIGIFSDISFIVRENETKINLALHDPLTGLCNRSLLEDRFNLISGNYMRQGSKSQITDKQVALLFIDINHFKQINDKYGHLAGDNVLTFVAHILKKCARLIDTVARLGGDEFVVLLNGITKKSEVERYIKRVLDATSCGKLIDNLLLKPTLSLGVSFFPTQASNFNTLLANGDKAMYYSKRNKLSVTFYSDNA